ncbi:MAG: hypothetical protein AMJ93_08605 [Anaerolineae bacterium SM23_84]|nr:MAG: hypothetical protein AMJ93_08605 [Anaerolineae bacterium SM23_84]
MEEQASDLLMWVGATYYPTSEDFASECIHQGLSKRTAITSVPEGIVNGVSRLFLIHPWACLTVDEENGHTLEELHDRLESLDNPLISEWLQDWDRNPAWVIRQIIEKTSKEPPAQEPWYEATMIIEDCGVIFTPGVFGFSYITGMQYVVSKGETDLPDELKDRGIEPVRVVYDEEEQDAESNS